MCIHVGYENRVEIHTVYNTCTYEQQIKVNLSDSYSVNRTSCIVSITLSKPCMSS